MRKLGYKYMTYVINKNNVKNFEFMDCRRDISNTHVSKMHGFLIKGGVFDAPLVLNKIGGVYKVVDGNHRIEAIKRFFNTKNGGESIPIAMAVYNDLTEFEERAVYTKWSIGKTQSISDVLQLYQKTIDLWTHVQRDDCPVPVTMTGGKSALKFQIVLCGLYNYELQKDSFKYKILTKREVIRIAQSFDFEDYKIFREFMKLFLVSFGTVCKSNMFCRNNFVTPLMSVFYSNMGQFDDVRFQKDFSRLNTVQKLKEYAMFNSREGVERIREIMIEEMNRGHRKNKYL